MLVGSGVRAHPAHAGGERVCRFAGRGARTRNPPFPGQLPLELRRSEPQEVAQLHLAAAKWYAQHGYVIDAVRHAEAGEDWTHAAELLVDHNLSLARNGQHTTLAALIAAFPSDGPPSAELACSSGIAS